MFVQEEIRFMYLKDKNPIKVLGFFFSTEVSNTKSLIFFLSVIVIVVIIIFVLYLLNCNWVLGYD